MSQAGQTGDQYITLDLGAVDADARAVSVKRVDCDLLSHDDNTPGCGNPTAFSVKVTSLDERHPGGRWNSIFDRDTRIYPPDADGWHTFFFGKILPFPAATDGMTVTVTVSELSNPDGTPLPTQHDFSVAIAEVEVLEAAVVLHSIPTDFAECQRDPFLADSTAVNGAGANAKPWIPADAGSRPHWYNSKSKAETGCQKAGCLRLATDAELEGALYPKKELDGIVWQDGSPTGRATPHFRNGLCARGWVSDRDDLRFWMPKDGKNAEACPAGYSSKPASQKGSAYCVGCPAIHRCTSLSLPPSPNAPPTPPSPPSPPPPMIPLPADLDATALDACYEEEEQGAVGEGQHYITRHWVEALYMCEKDPLCVGLVRMKVTGLIYVRRGSGPWNYGASTRRVRKADCFTAPPPPPAAALAACIASRSFPDNTLKKDNKPEFQRQSWEFGCQSAHDLTASAEECTANVRGLAAWVRRPGGCCGFVDGCHSSACSGGACCEASGEIADLACATYWLFVPPPPSPPPRLCSVGVLNPSGSICCESTCDQCGNTGCGAAANCDNQGRGCGGLCCQEEISDSGVMCMNANDDVCIMPSPPSSPPPSPPPPLLPPATAATGPTIDLEGRSLASDGRDRP